MLYLAKLKAFADNELDETQKQRFVFKGQKTLWVKKKMLVSSIWQKVIQNG